MSTKPTVLLGETWGEGEARLGVGFVGPSGIELLKMLDEADFLTLTSVDREYISRYYREAKPELIDAIWRLHPEFHRANVFNYRPTGGRLVNDCVSKTGGSLPGFGPVLPSKYIPASFAFHLERLADELLTVDPNLIVCLGNAALWSLSGSASIDKRRGTTLLSTHTAADFKLLPTYNPAYILRDWSLRPITVLDLAKAGREAGFPELRRPQREVWTEPTLADIERFINEHIRGCRILGVDIETAGNQITNIGFAPSAQLALNVPFYDSRAKGGNYWHTVEDEVRAWSLIRPVLCDPTILKVYQNGLYDLAFKWRSIGVPTLGAEEDTMLLHHALYPESLKGLGFLGSLYTDEGAWKQERRTSTIKRDE